MLGSLNNVKQQGTSQKPRSLAMSNEPTCANSILGFWTVGSPIEVTDFGASPR
jgi:hypothetical protein